MKETAQIVQEQLKEIGVTVELEGLDGGEFFPTPPDLIDPPAGCPFAARCKYCMNICTKTEPPEYIMPAEACRSQEEGGSREEEHRTACWLYHPDSGYQDIEFDREAEI